jgi:Cu(I)/Ag(I) efflux system membrane protein CusA/SilA
MVIIIFLMIILAGLYALYNLPVDAIPDLSDVQVIISSHRTHYQ